LEKILTEKQQPFGEKYLESEPLDSQPKSISELDQKIEVLAIENISLKKLHSKYYHIFQNVPISYVLINENGFIVEANFSTVNLIGFSIDILKSKRFIDFIYPSDQEIYRNFQEKYFSNKNSINCELRILTNDCSELWVNLKSVPINKDDTECNYCLVLEDISSRKSAELKREIGESEKEVLINSTDDIIWSVTREFNLITCNKAFIASAKYFSGVEFKPGMNVLLRDHYTKEMVEFWESLYIRALMGDSIKVEYYVPFTDKTQESWLEVNVNPIYIDNIITSLACFGRNITKRKQDEIKLFQAFKMASLGEMAGGVAHEINNPLSILLGFSSKLERTLQKPDFDLITVLEDIKKIKDTTLRISSIVKGLSAFSRNADKDPFLNISLKTVIMDTLGLCQEKFKIHGVDVLIDDLQDIQIEGRATQISQVLLNLINNSYDAIQQLPNKWIRLSLIKLNQSTVKIEVIDSGKGIPPEIVEKLMQPFFTTKEVGKGTGLGLSISLGILQSHGGILRYEKQSINTKFIIELPIAQKQK
jgi:PAS domain S-box-containing protein